MTDDERLGKAAMAGYSNRTIGSLVNWGNLDESVRRRWILAAKTAIKEHDRLKWEENLAYAKEFG